ncbi:Splicing factor 3B subunit 4 [Auxenochlorella protothecoides]|uniref:Splicing factor 3B subunit 4 n=1 Tax=Auxenochlorella protothecoides TaxID=3075 RepID=A0A087SE73_AUXPR|nr:Splicing factor 3B subunit 4 [Auxenochlorella protothecoides]KFM24027.1 Splicing factor 3B subunit 4 [Auxenochlorella protothecoides]
MHSTDRNQEATVYVGNVDPQVTEELLWELFVQAGPVVNVYMPKDRVTNLHQSYGFVEFRSEEDADYSIKILNMTKLYGKPIRVNKASQDKFAYDVGANLFIGNLDPDVDEKLLHDTFGAFGVVVGAPKVMRDPDTGLSKGFGFVSFDDFESSDAAIEAMDGQFLMNRTISVGYAFKKDTRGERHGTPAERLLAAQKKLQSKEVQRPHTRFATGPRQVGLQTGFPAPGAQAAMAPTGRKGGTARATAASRVGALCRRGPTATAAPPSGKCRAGVTALTPAAAPRIPADTQATAEFTAKTAGVVAGLWVAGTVFARVDPTIALTWRVTEGQRVERGARLGSAHGPARALLAAERVALNFMQRAGGIATATAAMAAEAAGMRAVLLDTRKTAPGLRLLDKWAVAAGGGANHRMGLFDMVMIKDNHIAAAGGITAAVVRAESYLRERGIQCGLEVEASTLEEVRQVISILDHQPDTLVTRIMLDNMTRRQEDGSLDVSLLREALALIGNRRVETEASGNVTLDTVRVIAETGVQFISTGSTTHSVTALDISLNIKTA